MEMVDSVDDLKSSRSIKGKDFPNFECWTRGLLLLRTRSPRIPISRRRSARRNKARGSVPSQKTDRLHDTTAPESLVLMIPFLVMLIYSLSLFVGLRFSGQPPESSRITEGRKSLGTNSTSTLHKSCAASGEHPRNKGPSLNKIQVKIPHQRNPCPMKFEDRSQEETERQERYACEDGWRLAKNIKKLKEKGKATLFSPTDGWSLPSTI